METGETVSCRVYVSVPVCWSVLRGIYVFMFYSDEPLVYVSILLSNYLNKKRQYDQNIPILVYS